MSQARDSGGMIPGPGISDRGTGRQVLGRGSEHLVSPDSLVNPFQMRNGIGNPQAVGPSLGINSAAHVVRQPESMRMGTQIGAMSNASMKTQQAAVPVVSNVFVYGSQDIDSNRDISSDDDRDVIVKANVLLPTAVPKVASSIPQVASQPASKSTVPPSTTLSKKSNTIITIPSIEDHQQHIQYKSSTGNGTSKLNSNNVVTTQPTQVRKAVSTVIVSTPNSISNNNPIASSGKSTNKMQSNANVNKIHVSGKISSTTTSKQTIAEPKQQASVSHIAASAPSTKIKATQQITSSNHSNNINSSNIDHNVPTAPTTAPITSSGVSTTINSSSVNHATTVVDHSNTTTKTHVHRATITKATPSIDNTSANTKTSLNPPTASIANSDDITNNAINPVMTTITCNNVQTANNTSMSSNPPNNTLAAVVNDTPINHIALPAAPSPRIVNAHSWNSDISTLSSSDNDHDSPIHLSISPFTENSYHIRHLTSNLSEDESTPFSVTNHGSTIENPNQVNALDFKPVNLINEDNRNESSLDEQSVMERKDDVSYTLPVVHVLDGNDLISQNTQSIEQVMAQQAVMPRVNIKQRIIELPTAQQSEEHTSSQVQLKQQPVAHQSEEHISPQVQLKQQPVAHQSVQQPSIISVPIIQKPVLSQPANVALIPSIAELQSPIELALTSPSATTVNIAPNTTVANDHNTNNATPTPAFSNSTPALEMIMTMLMTQMQQQQQQQQQLMMFQYQQHNTQPNVSSNNTQATSSVTVSTSDAESNYMAAPSISTFHSKPVVSVPSLTKASYKASASSTLEALLSQQPVVSTMPSSFTSLVMSYKPPQDLVINASSHECSKKLGVALSPQDLVTRSLVLSDVVSQETILSSNATAYDYEPDPKLLILKVQLPPRIECTPLRLYPEFTWRALLRAGLSSSGKLAIAEQAQSKGVDVYDEIPSFLFRTLFHPAATSAKIVTDFLLDRKFDVRYGDGVKDNCVMLACRLGRLDFLYDCHKRGITINTTACFVMQNGVFHQSSQGTLCDWLLSNGLYRMLLPVLLIGRDEEQDAAFQASSSLPPAVKLVVDKDTRRTLLHDLVTYPWFPEQKQIILAILSTHPQFVNQVDKDGQTALTLAIRFAAKEAIQALLLSHVDVWVARPYLLDNESRVLASEVLTQFILHPLLRFELDLLDLLLRRSVKQQRQYQHFANMEVERTELLAMQDSLDLPPGETAERDARARLDVLQTNILDQHLLWEQLYPETLPLLSDTKTQVHVADTNGITPIKWTQIMLQDASSEETHTWENILKT